MPKPKGPLYQKKEEAEGGGNFINKTLSSNPLGKGLQKLIDAKTITTDAREAEFQRNRESSDWRDSTKQLVADAANAAGNLAIPIIGPALAAKQFAALEGGDPNQLVEGDPAQQTEVTTNQFGSGSVAEGTVGLWQQGKPIKAFPKKTGKGSGSRTRIMGVIEPGNTAQELSDNAAAAARIRQYKWMVGLAYGRAGKVSQAWHENMAELYANDSEEVYRIIDEEFPKFKQAQIELQNDLEDIRTLRVNPYNYLQTAGRGGRAGAVLATMVGQMAAGAGNVNTARNALKNAIDRDIEVQAANIELQYKGVEAASKNIQEQISLLHDEILFRDKAQAYAWEAASAVIKAALQGAANEATYLGLQVMDDYATIQASAAAAALRAKQSSLYLEEPVRNAAQIQKALNLGKQGLQALQKAYQTGRNSAPVEPPVERPALRYSDPAMQAEMEQVGQALAPLSSGQPQAAAPQTAAPQAQAPPQPRRPSRGSSPRKSFKAQMEFSLEEAGIAPADTIQSKLAKGINVPDEDLQAVTKEDLEQAQKDREQRVRAFQNRYFESQINPNAPWAEQLASAGSEAAAQEESQGRVVAKGPGSKFQDIGTMVDDALTTPGIFFGSQGKRALTLSDARKIQQAWVENAPRTEINEYIGKYAENFEAPTDYEGYSNTIKSAVYGRIHLRANAPVRGSTAVRAKVNKEVSETDIRIRQLRKLSDLILKVQPGSFLGFRYDTEEGKMRWTKTDVSQGQALREIKELMDRVSVQWIKSLDPAGRLSDQDFERAQAAIASIADSRPDQLVSWVQQAFSGGEASAIQQSMSAYFKTLAIDAEQKLYDEIGQFVVQSPQAYMESKKRTEETSAWLRERLIEQGERVDPTEFKEKFKINKHDPNQN